MSAVGGMRDPQDDPDVPDNEPCVHCGAFIVPWNGPQHCDVCEAWMNADSFQGTRAEWEAVQEEEAGLRKLERNAEARVMDRESRQDP